MKEKSDFSIIVTVILMLSLLSISYNVKPASALADCRRSAEVDIVCGSEDFCSHWIMGEQGWPIPIYFYKCLDNSEANYQRCTISHRRDNHYHWGNWCSHKTICEHHSQPCGITWDRCWENCWDMIWNQLAPGCFPVGWSLEDCHYEIISCVCGGGGGGGGGCPFVSTWDGIDYQLDNNLIPAAEHSNGTDVIDYYKLQQPLAWIDGKYTLLVWDLDKHSFIDRIMPIAIDHESDVNLAVTPSGEILTYKNPIAPISAVDNYGNSCLSAISGIDNIRYEGHYDDYLLLDFGNVDVRDGAKLVLRADMYKMSIHVQVLNQAGEWIDVGNIIPRIYMATEIMDLSAFLQDTNGDLKVRLYFTGTHIIDFIGLDTTRQGEFEIRRANLVSAVHSLGTDEKDVLMRSDDIYAELVPAEQITLKFSVPQNNNEVRDIILMVEGHWFLFQG